METSAQSDWLATRPSSANILQLTVKIYLHKYVYDLHRLSRESLIVWLRDKDLANVSGGQESKCVFKFQEMG